MQCKANVTGILKAHKPQIKVGGVDKEQVKKAREERKRRKKNKR